MITEKAWHFKTRDWVAGRILNCIKKHDGPTRETHIYSVAKRSRQPDETSYPSWATISDGQQKKFIEISMRALIRRGQVIVVGSTSDVRAEGGVTRLYELGTVLDRLAAAHGDLPPVGKDE